MKQITKIVLLGIAFCLLAFTIAVGIMLMTIEPNDYKSRIAFLLKSQIGRDVSFEGDIKFSLFPLINVKTGRVVINNPPDFQEQPFLTLSKSEIQVKLWPLLYRKIEVAGINLVDLTVNLQKDKRGLNNWADLGVDPVSSVNVNNVEGNGFSTFFSSAIGSIEVQNGWVNWDDRIKATQFELKNIQFNSGPIVIGNPVAINLSLTLSGTPIKAETDLKLTTLLRVDEALDHFIFNDSHLDYAGYNPLSSNVTLNAGLTMHEAAINRSSQRLNLTGLQFESAGLDLHAELNVENFMDNPSIRSAINIAPFDAQVTIKQWGIALPATSNPKALTDLSMDFQIHASNGLVEIIGLNLTLDKSRIGGSMALKSFNQPSILFDLTVDKIDADEYRAVEDKSKNSERISGTVAFAELMEKVKKFDANGQLRFGKLKINNTLFEEVNLKLNSKNGFETGRITRQKPSKRSTQ